MRLEIIVPYNRDSAARERNRELFENFWWEYDYHIIEDYTERARAYNEFASSSTADIIALADIDAHIPSESIHEAMEMFEDGADLVYPFTRIENVYPDSDRPNDVWPAYYDKGLFPMFKRTSFIAMGGENELFQGYGWEDLERYFRALNNDYDVRRVDGVAHHMDHGWRSRMGNPHIRSNWELMKVERDEYENRINDRADRRR